MNLTRRTLLQTAGAAASAATVSGSTGVLATAGSRETALAVGHGPYIIVREEGAPWLCTNYHDAVHHASMFRHTTMEQTKYLRCSQALMSKLKINPHVSWINADGLAITVDEADKQGFEILRRATNPHKTRRVLWDHHLNTLRAHVDHADLSDPQTCWYTRHGDVFCVTDARGPIDAANCDEGTGSATACTPELAKALQAYTAGAEPLCEISKSVARHMCGWEYEDRLQNDQIFMIAVTRPTETHIAFDPASADKTAHLSVEREHGWLIPRKKADSENSKNPVSAHLAAVLEANGFAMPGFYREVRGVLHHLDEFAALTEPNLYGRPVRHQNRHV